MCAGSCFELPFFFLCKEELVKSEKCHFSLLLPHTQLWVVHSDSRIQCSAVGYHALLQDREVCSHSVGHFDFRSVECSIVNSKNNLMH